MSHAIEQDRDIETVKNKMVKIVLKFTPFSIGFLDIADEYDEGIPSYDLFVDALANLVKEDILNQDTSTEGSYYKITFKGLFINFLKEKKL